MKLSILRRCFEDFLFPLMQRLLLVQGGLTPTPPLLLVWPLKKNCVCWEICFQLYFLFLFWSTHIGIKFRILLHTRGKSQERIIILPGIAKYHPPPNIIPVIIMNGYVGQGGGGCREEGGEGKGWSLKTAFI